MRKTKSIVCILESGRSIESCNFVAKQVITNPEYFPELVFGMWHVDGGVRTRVADAIEKVTAKRPELLQPFKNELLGLLPHARPAAMRWHLAQILPRLSLSQAERRQAMAQMEGYLADESSLVKTFAMNSLANLAAACDVDIQRGVTKTIRKLQKTGTPAMKVRARKILAGAA